MSAAITMNTIGSSSVGMLSPSEGGMMALGAARRTPRLLPGAGQGNGHGPSNLSCRFRRAVMDDNLPLARRLADTALKLSSSDGRSAHLLVNAEQNGGPGSEGAARGQVAGMGWADRRASAAETVRGVASSGVGVSSSANGRTPGHGAGNGGDDNVKDASTAASTTTLYSARTPTLASAASVAALATTPILGSTSAEEEDNPMTPTLRSHWGARGGAVNGAVRHARAMTTGATSTLSGRSGGSVADESTSASSRPSTSRAGDTSAASTVSSFSPFSLPVSKATSDTASTSTSANNAVTASVTSTTRQGSSTDSMTAAEQYMQRTKPATCPLPPIIRFARSRTEADERRYITPSERAARAQRAALDGPFTIQNVDLSSTAAGAAGAGKEGRKSSLVLALECGTSIEMIDWLLEMGHEAEGPSKDSDDNSVLALAAIHNRCDVIERYSIHPDVDVGSLIHSKSASDGRTALHWAAVKGHDAVIRLLVSLGADVDALDANDNTPLHFASAWGHLTSVQLLKELGARLDLANKQGFRALDWAFDGNIKIVLESFSEQAGAMSSSSSSAMGQQAAHRQRSHSQSLSYGPSTSTEGQGVGPAPAKGYTGPISGQPTMENKPSAPAPPEVGMARSVLMSRDQAAMQLYRRAAPRAAMPTSTSGSTVAGAMTPSSSSSSSTIGIGLGQGPTEQEGRRVPYAVGVMAPSSSHGHGSALIGLAGQPSQLAPQHQQHQQQQVRGQAYAYQHSAPVQPQGQHHQPQPYHLTSPQRRPLVLRSGSSSSMTNDGGGGTTGRKSLTLSPETLRAVPNLPRSPPAHSHSGPPAQASSSASAAAGSPPVQLAQLR